MILITGATGFIGSHLAAELLKKNTQLRAIYRSKDAIQKTKRIFDFHFEDSEAEINKIEWVEGDLRDVGSLSDAIQGAEAVYHCAGFISFSARDHAALMEVNRDGTAEVVNACLTHGIKKMCHVSSVATLQVDKHKKQIDELSVWKSNSRNSSYSISKYLGEFEVWRGLHEGLQAVIVNPSFVIGPGCEGQASHELFKEMQRPHSFYFPGSTGFVDIRDVTQCMLRLMDENRFGSRYILNSENITFRAVSDVFSAIHKNPRAKRSVGKTALYLANFFETIQYGILGRKRKWGRQIIPSLMRHNQYENQKISDELTHRFIPVHQSIEDTIRWYEKNKRD